MSAEGRWWNRRRVYFAGMALVLACTMAGACVSTTQPPPPPDDDRDKDPTNQPDPDGQGFLGLPTGVEGFLV